MYVVTVQPETEPLSLSEALEQCHGIPGNEDTTVESYIRAARQWIELTYDRALITQTRQKVFPCLSRSYVLEGSPVQSIVSFEYRGSDGNWVPWSSSNYVLDDLEGCLVEAKTAVRPGIEYYQVNPVRITYVCGYGASPQQVPEPFRQVIRLLVAFYFQNREAASLQRVGVESIPVPFGIATLLANY